MRGSIIEWIEPVAANLGYSPNTFFQALQIIDTVFSQQNIKMEERNIVIFVCLYMAAKLQEKDSKLP
jgi:hypothetical protein